MCASGEEVKGEKLVGKGERIESRATYDALMRWWLVWMVAVTAVGFTALYGNVGNNSDNLVHHLKDTCSSYIWTAQSQVTQICSHSLYPVS